MGMLLVPFWLKARCGYGAAAPAVPAGIEVPVITELKELLAEGNTQQRTAPAPEAQSMFKELLQSCLRVMEFVMAWVQLSRIGLKLTTATFSKHIVPTPVVIFPMLRAQQAVHTLPSN